MAPETANNLPILITGATGHTGRRAVRCFLDHGRRVRCLVHTPAHRSKLPQHDSLEIVYGSASNPVDLAKAIEGVDTVVHLAHIRYAPVIIDVLSKAAASASQPNTAESPLSLAVESPPTSYRFLAMSSTRLLSRFTSETQEAVRRGENAITSAPASIQWTIIRPSMIFGGPDDNNLERMASFLMKWRVFPLFGSGNNLVQPIFVLDLVQAIYACLERPSTAGHVYTLAGPQPITYRDMVAQVARASGAKPPIFIQLPLNASLAAIKRLQSIWPACPLSPEMVERFGEDRVFDITEAQRDFSFAPIDFSKALEQKFKREV